MELLEDRLAPAIEPTFRGGLTVAAADIDGDRIPDFVGAPSADAPVRVAIYAGTDGGLIKTLTPFEAEFTGGAFVAVGDVTGDGKPEVIVSAASGEPRVVVFEAITGELQARFLAYDASFGGGVRVAVGDIDGDGRAEIVTAPGTGGGPHIRVFDGVGRNLGRDYMAYDPTFRGGASVAAGDTDGDGVDDIITGAGVGGGPHVVVVSGRTDATLESYFAYNFGFQGGVWVSAGDVDGNGLTDVITGAGTGGGAHVRAFAGRGTPFAEWFAYEPEFHGGVRVAVADLNGDGFADVITGPGVGGGPRVTMWDGYQFTRTQNFFGVTDGQPLGFGLLAPPPRTPLYDGVTFVTPGAPGTHTRLTSDVLRRFTDLPGEMGVFRVDDREGRVGGLLPGAEGYGKAALAQDRRTQLFTPDAAPGTGGEFELEGGTRYGFYLIRGGRYEDWVASGFTDRFGLGAVFPFAAANPGGTQQFRAGPRNRAAFEDVSGLDGDFNDVIVDVRLTGEASDLPGGTARPPNTLPANRPPDAVNDVATTGFETPVLVSVLANDTDSDGDLLTIASATKPAHGTLRVVGSRIDYTPDTGFEGIDAFSYTVADGRGGTDTAGVIVTVGSPNLPPPPSTNRPPVAADDVVATAFETAVTIDVLANDTDPDTDPLSVTGTTQPPNGSVRIVGGRIEYAPAIGFRGIDTFEYTIEDGRGGRNTAVVTVSVGSSINNNSPIARDDSAVTRFETIVAIDVLANDTDADGDPLTVTLASTPTHGTARLAGNRVEYSPAPGFVGADTLTYAVRDGRGGSNTAVVRVTVEPPTLPVNRPPDAVNDTAFAAFQTAVLIDVLANDTDPDGDPLTVATTAAPAHGSIRLVGTRIEYTPDAGHQGIDVFHYAVADGRGGGDVASVSVTVEPPVTVKDFTDWTPAERGGSATRRGTVAIAGTTATLREGDSFVTTLSRSFTVVAGATPLQFTYSGLQFDSGASSFVKDSFEAALVDAAGNALVAAYSPGRDAFFNVTDGQPAVTGAGTSLDARAVSLDLSAVPVGTAATLIFRLVNNDSDRGSTVTLTSYTLPTTVKVDAPVKFFVVDPAADKTFRYGVEGLSAGRFVLPAGEVRGVASNPAGDTVWTVDRSSKQIRVSDATGNPLGNWIASDALSPEGVTVNNGDLWLVDRGSHTVRHYIGGAVRRSGAVAASDFFALSLDNSNPSDLVTDGGTVWVTDDVRAEVFVYDVSGALLGRWKLDGDNAVPSGITRNPAGGTDLWVVDRGTKQVFQYSNGSNLRTGSATADGTFDLGPDVTSPEGIADPPQSAAGHSLLDESGRAVFDSGADFSEGALFNLTAVDGTGDLRLNDQGVTEIPPFIWVSNASEGSVSRFDTRTGVEVARYRTGPESLGARLSPSRTAVAGDGSAWVANRSNRDGGTLSSIVHVYLEDFVDRNGNGKIDTSVDADNNGQIDAAEMLLWDANNDGQPDDERIAISIDVGRDRNDTAVALPNSVARAIAIDANDNVWVGLFNRQQYEAYDGASGSLLGIVPVSGTPYGAVVDNKGVLWGATRAGFVERIDTATMQALPSVNHPGDNYGVTVGPDGAVWTSNYFSSNLVRIDPDTLASTQYAAPGYGNFRGVSVDDDNNVWVATNSPDALVRFHFDADGKTLIDTRGVRVGSVASAAVIDADGYVWTTTYGDNKAWKIDPVTLAVVPGWPIATGPEPYNYSDMTGRVRLGVTQRTGTWTETVDAGRDNAVWGGVELDAFLPDLETSVVVRARSADSAAALSQLGWRTIDPGTAYRDVRGRYLQVELSLRSREPDFNPVVNSFAVVSVPPPQLSVTAPADGSSLPPGSSVVLSGLATASRPPLGSGHFGPNRVVAVTVNGQPVEALDASGRFFTRVGVLPGENRYAVVAYDEYGQSASVVHTAQSLARPTAPLDSRQFVDLSSTFKAEYARTSFHEDSRSLFTNIAVRNGGNYPASVPLFVGVKNISDPTVKALNPAGTLDDGTPYYDFTGLVSGGGKRLEPNAATGQLDLAFSVPERKRFTYDLVFLGVLNRPPAFTTVPALEANPTRPYAYDSNADDPDGDALRYSLVAGPDGMTLNSTSGLLNWTPTETQLGSFDVTIQADDGRSGSAEQRYTIVSQVAPPNRPPVFTSIPVDQASVGGVYRYDADAIDPDDDALTYSLATGAPAGMAIDATTGVITWTPTATQLGDRPVTVAVADGRGGTATQAFTICVDADRNRPPVIVSDPVTVAQLDKTTSGGFTPGELYVASSVTHEIRIYDPETLEYRRSITHPLFAEQYSPRGMVFNQRGRLVVSTNQFFLEFAADGSELARYTKAFLEPTEFLVVDRLGNLYTTTQTGGSNRLNQYRASDYVFVQTITLPDGAGGLTGLTFDAEDRLYVSSQADGRVYVSEPSTDFTSFTFARSFPGPVENSGPEGIQITPQGQLLVAGGDLSLYDPVTGQLIRSFDAPNDAFPVAVTVDNAGRLYVGDWENGVGNASADLYRFTPNGSSFIQFNDPGLFGPYGLVISGTRLPGGPSVGVYTYDVEALDPDGGPLSYTLTEKPAGMTIDPTTGVIAWTPGLGENLVANGNFEQGVTGYQTQLGYAFSTQTSTYGLARNPHDPDAYGAFEPRVASFNDHTSGSGLMMLVNGSTAPDIVQWQEAISVSPDTTYQLSAWAANFGFFPGTEPNFRFVINGVQVGGSLQLPVAAGEWLQFSSTWNSGSSTSAIIQIYNDTLIFNGNDYALDDISFGEVVPAGQSVPVTVRVDDGRGGSDEQRFSVTIAECGQNTARGFEPVVEWKKDTFAPDDRPDSKQVMMTPAVIDLNSDGIPEIVFSTFGDRGAGEGIGRDSITGVLRAISGVDGSKIWTVTDPAFAVDALSGIAVGDVDRDGRPEIFAIDRTQTRILAFRSDGTGWWTSPSIPGGISAGSPSLADLDGDGIPEIVIGATVLNADGSIRWQGNEGTGSIGYGPISVVADLDRDGNPEVVAGRTAYRADGSVYWTLPGNDGFAAIGNFDADSYPEVVLTGDGMVRLHKHDGTILWTVTLPDGGRGGPATIADMDGDGVPEIGVASRLRYVAYRADGSILWQAAIQDGSSHITGSSVFDFDGDGQAEVVYGDEVFLRIYRGADGTELYRLPKSSGTFVEYPVIADVDGDGNAEILAVANTYFDPSAQNGIYVIGDRNNTWVNTRKIWNQHSYHVTNVNDDGTIPAHEANSWELYNSYRTNVLTEGFDPRAAADLIVSAATLAAGVTTARVENTGTAPVAPGVSVAFFDGDPAKGGRLLGKSLTATRLRTGDTEAVTFALAGLVNDLWVRVDDDGTGIGTVPECDETNNAFRAKIDTDPVNYAPVFKSTPLASVAANGRYLDRSVVLEPDGDPVTYAIVSGPEGLQVHPTLGVVAWTPFRDQVGPHNVVLRATDGHGNVTLQAFTVGVTIPNTAPVITSAAPTGQAVVGKPLEYAVSAQDAEQSTLFYSLVNPLAGMAVDSKGRFTWSPSAGDVGSKAATVRVSDGVGGITDQTFPVTVAVSAPNHAPVAKLDARTSAWLGRDYIGRIIASDADGDPMTFSLVNGPSGMTVDSAGVIRWQPVAVTDAPLPVEFKVSDGRTGGEVAVSYTLSVVANGSNTAPVIISVPRIVGTAESLYAYNLVARDADGDPVFWTLVNAPQGMSLDTLRGTLRWLPAHDQTGPAPVTVRVTDAYGESTEQAFTINVSCINQPPRITSVPGTIANANYSYGYAVRAVDPEGDPLSFSFDQAPAGMAFLPGTSVIRWIPTTAQVGPQSVTLRVTDQAGNFATQSFTVGVEAGAPNRSPVVTSKARTIATLNSPYTYAVTANDADGDPVDFALATAPVGMSIDKTSGVVTWLATEAGKNSVTVTASDGRGGRGVQTFTLTARANQAPTLAAVADRSVVAGATFRLSVTATDPDSDALTYGLVQAPTGTTIDSFGRLVWQSNAPPRAEPITVSVTDAGGLSDTRSFTLTLTPDTQAPNVSLFVSPNPVNQGQSVSVQVAATDNVGVASLAVGIVQGGVTTPLALTPQGTARFTPAIAGRYTFVATATDAAGNVGKASSELRAIDPNDRTGPTVSFTRLAQLLPGGQTRQFDPATGVASVTYLTDVFGTIHDADGQLDSWTVLVARADLVDADNLNPADPIWRTVATGTAEVNNGKIFTFDPTVLQNDRYTILVVAYDVNGRGTVKGVDIDVTGNAKLGEFKLEFTDLSLPLNGIPIQVTRVYDSRDTAESKDFGYGWTLGLRDAKIRETVPPGPGDGLFSEAKAFKDGTKVYLNLPDGQRAGFTFKPVVAGSSFFGTVYAPKFAADPGVAWKLEVDNSAIKPNARGEFQTLLFPLDFNPDGYRLISPDGMTYSYSQSAGLQRIDDKNGNFVTFTPSAITHSGGRSIAIDRDGQGRVTAIHLPDGTVAVRYRYDSKGDLIEVKQVTEVAPTEKALTSTISYRTDRPHYLDEYFDANGKRAVKTEYDPVTGRLVAVTDANSDRSEQSFDTANFAETVKDARGNPTVITYNDRGNVTKTVQPTEFGDIVTQYEYGDPLNPDKETKVINPRGFETTKTYYATGDLKTETTADGTTEYKYSAANKLTAVKDTLGRTTAYDYSPSGNLVSVVNPLGDDSTFTYDDLGRVKTFTDFVGNMTKFEEYCACGRPMKTINPDGSFRRIETNGYSQVTKVTDEVGNVTENFYDQQGRLVRVVDGEKKATQFVYEGANQTQVINALGNETVYAYDDGGRKTRITDAEGGVTMFTYDANGNLETVTDPVNNLTRFVYDAASRVKEEIDPLGASRFFEYDAAGNKVETTDRNGRLRTFSYDALNRQTAETWYAGDGSVIRAITSAYDKVGNLLQSSDPDATLTYTYDPLNRVRTATTLYSGTGLAATTLTYGYDANGNRTSVVDEAGVRVDSVYDSRNRLELRTWQGGGIDAAKVVYDYFDNGERKSLTRYSDATGTIEIGSTNYFYWKNGLSKSIVHSDGSGELLAGYAYQYDAAGRLIQETHHGDAYAYGYDKTGQLKTVFINGVLSESFTYDANGNRKTSTGPNGPQAYLTGRGNQLLNDGLFAYTYDREGSLKTKSEIATGIVSEYSWDYRNRLLKVEQWSGGGIILSLSEYGYDSQGHRITQKIDGDVLFTEYDAEHAWLDRTSTAAIVARYLFGDRIDETLARWKPVLGTAWYLTDKLGSIRDSVGATGALVNTVDYTAFGQIVSQSNATAGDRFAFAGREWDSSIGEYFNRARYYDPTAGWFISIDPIGFASEKYHLYSYASNSPLNFTDPSGLANLGEYSAINGIAIGVLSGTASFNLYAVCQTIQGNQITLLGTANAVAIGFAVGYAIGAGLVGSVALSLTAAAGIDSASIAYLLSLFGRGIIGPAGSITQLLALLVPKIGTTNCVFRTIKS